MAFETHDISEYLYQFTAYFYDGFPDFKKAICRVKPAQKQAFNLPIDSSLVER
ncbi:MAG: hypothetical protein AAF934_07645 [Bacteroidota bacterium]